MTQLKAATSEAPGRDVFFSLVSQHVKTLNRFVRHEIAQLESVGDLLKGELTPQDVVDAVLLRAYREYVGESGPPEVSRGWLMRLAREQIEAEVKERKSEREDAVRIEDDIPETPPAEQASTQGEEILYFYEPEEDLKVEDLVPDLKMPTPAQEVEAQELQSCLRAALAEMPKDWRRALVLHHVEDLSGAELAEAVGRPEQELPQILEQARRYLRERLIASGCQFELAS
jgi:RNA polymerase sigma factor (sigma-70 family)